jgi:ribosomal protein L7/L12
VPHCRRKHEQIGTILAHDWDQAAAALAAPRERPEGGREAEVVVLVGQGRKIQAIKRYRELNPGTGLKEAKDVIDEIAEQLLSSGGSFGPQDGCSPVTGWQR